MMVNLATVYPYQKVVKLYPYYDCKVAGPATISIFNNVNEDFWMIVVANPPWTGQSLDSTLIGIKMYNGFKRFRTVCSFSSFQLKGQSMSRSKYG